MLPIKAILFDLDDTLWPIVPVIVRAETIMYDWLRAHAPRVVQQVTIESLRARRVALMASEPRYALDLSLLRHTTLTEVFVSSGEDIAKVDHAMAVFTRARNAVELFDDVQPALVRLTQQFTLGSISNGAADLEAIGLDHHFQISVAAHRFGRAKPDPSIFHSACDALGIQPAEAVYVGDDPLLDVEGAQKAGLRGVWINRPGAEPQRTLPAHVVPDAICANLFELERWLTSETLAN